MGHAIPKIVYNVKSFSGDTTNLSDTITNIASTTDIVVGMLVSGPNITDGSTVVSKTSSTIQLSIAATGTSASQDFEAFYKIDFDYPPVEQKEETFLPQERRSVSLTGLTQVSIDFIEGVRDLNFRFLSDSLYTQLKSFYTNFAAYGDSFRLYDDKTLTSYNTYELKNFDWSPERIAPKSTSYVRGVKMQFRRVT